MGLNVASSAEDVFDFLYRKLPAPVAEEAIAQFIRAANSGISGPDRKMNAMLRAAMRGK